MKIWYVTFYTRVRAFVVKQDLESMGIKAEYTNSNEKTLQVFVDDFSKEYMIQNYINKKNFHIKNEYVQPRIEIA